MGGGRSGESFGAEATSGKVVHKLGQIRHGPLNTAKTWETKGLHSFLYFYNYRIMKLVKARRPEVDDEEMLDAASAFAALGSEHRLAILLRLVRAGPDGMATGDLGEQVGITGSVLTHHLKPLVAAGLVYQKRDGRRIISHVDHRLVEDLSNFLLAECCADKEDLPEGHSHG